MEVIKSYVYSVCLTLIIVSILTVIIPQGKIKGFTNAVLSIFIFLSFITPIRNINTNIKLPYISEQITANQNEAYSSIIDANILNTLDKGNYHNCRASCKVSIDDNELKIEKVVISINDKYDREEVKNYIFSELGIVAEVNYIGD